MNDPIIRDVVKHWAAEFQENTGVDPTPDIPWFKACQQIAGIVRHHGAEEAKALISLMFTTSDPFIQQSDRTLGVFVAKVSKLRVERRNGPTAALTKTSGNAAAIDEAGRRIREREAMGR